MNFSETQNKKVVVSKTELEEIVAEKNQDNTQTRVAFSREKLRGREGSTSER